MAELFCFSILGLVEAAVDAAPEADLLEETEKLMKEKVEVQRQAEKENNELLKQVKKLESELEEEVNKVIEIEQENKAEIMDLRQQIQALEKQLEKNRKFLDVEVLINQLKDKTDGCSELVLGKEQLQRDVQERNEEIEKLESRIRELEQALISSSDRLQKISNLEEQLEQFREELENKNEEVQQLHMQMEIQRKELSTQHQELNHQNTLLKVEVLINQLKDKTDGCSELVLGKEQLQRDVQERNEEIEKLESRIRELEQALISSSDRLQKVEERKHYTPVEFKGEITLEAQLQTEREALDRKEKEISNLEEQLEQFREELENKNEEVQQLHMQMEIQRKELSTQHQELNHQNTLLKHQVEDLLKSLNDSDDVSIEDHRIVIGKFSQVMQEKDKEIEHLNEQLHICQQQLEFASDNKVIEEKNEQMRELESQIECLKSEQECLKRKSEDEIEQLNEVIETLQQELAKIEHKTQDDDPEEPSSLKHPLEMMVEEKETPMVQEKSCKEVSLTKEEFEGMKVKIQQANQELETLKADHLRLLQKYKCLQEEGSVISVEKISNMTAELEEALREKTTTVLVIQAEIKALEESANVKITTLEAKQEELEAFVREKNAELDLCHSQEVQAQAKTELLKQKIIELEDKLREKVAAALVSQAQLGAVQEQSKVHTKELHNQIKELQGHSVTGVGLRETAKVAETVAEAIAVTHGFTELDNEKQDRKTEDQPKNKLSVLTLKLTELEKELAELQKDRELQRQLVHSTEEGVVEYEKKLAQLLARLDQMKKPIAEKQDVRELTITQLQENLQQAMKTKPERDEPTASSQLASGQKEAESEAAAMQEELNSYKEWARKQKDELQATKSKLESDEPAAVSKLVLELEEVKSEAAIAKEELNSYSMQAEKLKDELQERELTIANLQDDLQQATKHIPQSNEPAAISKLVLELEQVKSEAAVTKEELNSYRECAEKLKEGLQMRDLTIAQLQEDLKQVKEALAKAEQELGHRDQKRDTKLFEGKPDIVCDKTKHTSTKEKPSLVRKNSASQTDKPANVDRSFQTPNVLCKDAEIQIDLIKQNSISSEQLTEVIRQYQEKIGQMQELHAAEIMDMETRHICESDTLKSESQILREQCKALNSFLEKMRATGGISASVLEPGSSQFRDGYTSDSSSDWSQRMYYDFSVQNQEYRSTPEEAKRDNEMPQASSEILPDRIKYLLREVHQEGMQVLSLSEVPCIEGEIGTSEHYSESWQKERQALLATVESLKVLITNMQVYSDTETSLNFASAEGVADWRGELLQAIQQVFLKERSVLKIGHQDYTLQDNQASVVELEVNRVKEGGNELKDRFHSEKMVIAELKNELAQTKLELETTLKAQHKHLKELEALRTEVSEKTAEMDMLNDALANEQKKSRELQWAFENEKCKSERKQEREKEEFEDLKFTLEDQKRKNCQISTLLEQERQAAANLKQQTETEKTLHQAQLSHELSRISELQVLLDSEKARALELNSALEQEKELRSQLNLSPQRRLEAGDSTADAGCSQMEDGVRTMKELLGDLQGQLDEKHTRIVQLLEDMERHKLEVVQVRQQLDEERQLHRKALQKEQEAYRLVQDKLEQLQLKDEELQRLLDRERQLVVRLQQERERLQDSVSELQDQENQRENTDQPDPQTSLCRADIPVDRTRDWVLQQKISDVLTVGSSGHSLNEANGGTAAPADIKHLDGIIQRLKLIASKLKTLASKASSRILFEAADDENLIWLQNSIQDIVSQLQQLPATRPKGEVMRQEQAPRSILGVLRHIETAEPPAERDQDWNPQGISQLSQVQVHSLVLTSRITILTEHLQIIYTDWMHCKGDLGAYSQIRRKGPCGYMLAPLTKLLWSRVIPHLLSPLRLPHDGFGILFIKVVGGRIERERSLKEKTTINLQGHIGRLHGFDAKDKVSSVE
ncbi:UNVERIFIED_CONTAM: hypothetical protein FKN15_061979 [Acipenser sinensis]